MAASDNTWALLDAATKCEDVRGMVDRLETNELWPEKDKRRLADMFLRAEALLRCLASDEAVGGRADSAGGAVDASRLLMSAAEPEASAESADIGGRAHDAHGGGVASRGESDGDSKGRGWSERDKAHGAAPMVVSRAYNLAADVVMSRLGTAAPHELCAAFANVLRVRLQGESLYVGHGAAGTSPHLIAAIAAEARRQGWPVPEVPHGATLHSLVAMLCRSNATNAVAAVDCPEETAIIIACIHRVDFEHGRNGPEPKVVHVRVSYARGPVEACRSALFDGMAALQAFTNPADPVRYDAFERVPPDAVPHFSVEVSDCADCAGMEDLQRTFFLRGSDSKSKSQ
jgi:hypothetical protein